MRLEISRAVICSEPVPRSTAESFAIISSGFTHGIVRELSTLLLLQATLLTRGKTLAASAATASTLTRMAAPYPREGSTSKEVRNDRHQPGNQGATHEGYGRCAQGPIVTTT